MYCVECGNELPAGATVCSFCGARVQAPHAHDENNGGEASAASKTRIVIADERKQAAQDAPEAADKAGVAAASVPSPDTTASFLDSAFGDPRVKETSPDTTGALDNLFAGIDGGNAAGGEDDWSFGFDFDATGSFDFDEDDPFGFSDENMLDHAADEDLSFLDEPEDENPFGFSNVNEFDYNQGEELPEATQDDNPYGLTDKSSLVHATDAEVSQDVSQAATQVVQEDSPQAANAEPEGGEPTVEAAAEESETSHLDQTARISTRRRTSASRECPSRTVWRTRALGTVSTTSPRTTSR